jgi:hypothetical protein
MTRSLRAAACAASLFLIATAVANAQTAPTTSTTPATAPTADFMLPAVCQPSDRNTSRDETHGEHIRACIRALRAEEAETADHQGLGQWVSALARDNDNGDNPESDDASSTSAGSVSPNTVVSTHSTPDQPLSTDAHHEHARGHQHGED